MVPDRHSQPPTHVDLLQLQTIHQPLHHLVIQPPSVRKLFGFTENRLGFRGDVVFQVRQVPGDRTIIQVEMLQPIDDPRRNRRRLEAG